MKFTLIILTVLAPFFAHAGGGGGLRPGMQTMMMNRNPELIFNIGEQDDWVKFAHAKLVEQKWQIQKIEMHKDDLMSDAPLVKALEDSLTIKNWSEIK